MRLRSAVATDLPGIVAIEQRPDFRLFIGAWSLDKHLKNLEDPEFEYVVAVDEDEVLGGFVILAGLRNPHLSAEVARLAVSVPGNGLGRRLLAAAAASAFGRHKAHRLWLDAFDGNVRARHVYASFGFRQDGVFREANLTDGVYHDMVLLSMLDREYAALDERTRGGEGPR